MGRYYFPVKLPPTTYTFEPANENRATILEVAATYGFVLVRRSEHNGETSVLFVNCLYITLGFG
jgi:hypothetical protein